MWAQLIKMRIPSGNEEKLLESNRQWEEQVGKGTDSGWDRTFLFRSANDPDEWYELVYFESEDKARANEQSQKHQDLLGRMLSLIDGQPEYVDLTPVQESKR